MDDKWFKLQKKIAGVTDADIAERLGRDRSVVSKIVSGHQRMSLEWAQAFADVLKVPLGDVLEQAGAASPQVSQQISPGFRESDAAIWIAQGSNDRVNNEIAAALGARPGVDVWRVKTDSMVLAGLLPDDFILVDTHLSERVKKGDTVIAQVYDRQGGAKTVLRRYAPPVLVSSMTWQDEEPVYLIDNDFVSIRGKVVASWRTN